MTTPSMFPDEPADLAALAAIAAGSIPRAVLMAEARNLAKSTDLFELGYTVSHWFRLADRVEVLEFNPLHRPGRRSPLPRVTATTYEEQRAIHEALGARVVGRGRTFSTHKEPSR